MSTTTNLIINLKNYEFGETIGKGLYGEVILTKDKRTNTLIALKRMRKNDIIKNKQVEHAMNEIQIHNIIYHPFIADYYGFCQDSKYLYVACQLINGGDLFSYIRKNKFVPQEQAM